MKFLTLKTILKSSTNFYLLKPHLVTSATLLPYMQARPKETPLYQKTSEYNASLGESSSSYGVPSWG